MEFFRLIVDLDDARIVAMEQTPTALELRNELCAGRQLELKEPIQLFEMSEGLDLDYSTTLLSVPFVSPKAKSVFKHTVPNEVQFFEATIDSIPTPNSIMNIATSLDCLNETASTYIEITALPDGRGLFNAILKRKLIGDVHIFRIRGEEQFVVVSEYLRDAMLKAELTGGQFLPLETDE